VNQSGSLARTWIEVSREALLHNVNAVREAIGPSPSILAVVKANAYGHGSEYVADVLHDTVDYFGVACIEEAAQLSHLGKDIFLLSPCLPWEYEQAVAAGWIITLSSREEALAATRHGQVRINFKIDTGMGRTGCPEDQALEELRTIRDLPNTVVHSISSHLPSSDDDLDFTAAQLERIMALRQESMDLCPDAHWHALNSAGIFGFSDSAMEIVRAGLALYGIAYPGSFQTHLRPALQWKARVLAVRTLKPGATVSYGRTFTAPHLMRVATVSVGYADGFQRQASGQGAEVLISGKRCAVLGRVTMDQIIVDVSHLQTVGPGDVVTLIGKAGEEEISARELAERCNTIAWHIFTGLSGRVKMMT